LRSTTAAQCGVAASLKKRGPLRATYLPLARAFAGKHRRGRWRERPAAKCRSSANFRLGAAACVGHVRIYRRRRCNGSPPERDQQAPLAEATRDTDSGARVAARLEPAPACGASADQFAPPSRFFPGSAAPARWRATRGDRLRLWAARARR